MFIDEHLYKVSVKDMVESRCPALRTRDEFDVLGPSYRIPNSLAYLNKARAFKISYSKDLDALKEKKLTPGPTHYNVNQSLLFNKNVAIYKKERRSFCDDIIKQAKKTPGVGIYNALGLKEKIKGSFKR